MQNGNGEASTQGKPVKQAQELFKSWEKTVTQQSPEGDKDKLINLLDFKTETKKSFNKLGLGDKKNVIQKALASVNRKQNGRKNIPPKTHRVHTPVRTQ